MTDRSCRDITAIVRDKVAAALLPSGLPGSTWAGYGNDEGICSVCDRVVTAAEIEHEFESVSHGTVRFHYECLIAYGIVVESWTIPPDLHRLCEAAVRAGQLPDDPFVRSSSIETVAAMPCALCGSVIPPGWAFALHRADRPLVLDAKCLTVWIDVIVTMKIENAAG